MLVMARDTDYPGLLVQLSGKRVFIWTCSTCARLCNGIGGPEAADRLAEALRGDGIDVVGTAYCGASCLVPKVQKSLPETDCDVILSLTCDIGAANAGDVSGKPVVNPIMTFGPGYKDSEGKVRLRTIIHGKVVSDEALEDAAERSGCTAEPYV